MGEAGGTFLKPGAFASMEGMAASDGFAKNYSDKSFWKKLKRFARVAGKEVVSKALLLYYCYSDPTTPKWIKGVIVGALG